MVGKIGKALIVAGALATAAAGTAVAEGQYEATALPPGKYEIIVPQQNVQTSATSQGDTGNNWTADGIFVYETVRNLSMNRDFNVHNYISGGNVNRMGVYDPRSFIIGKEGWLNSTNPQDMATVKEWYTPASKAREMRFLAQELSKVNSEKRPAGYEKSLEELTAEMNKNNGILTKEAIEKYAIPGVTYVFDIGGYDPVKKEYDAPMFARFVKGPETSETQEIAVQKHTPKKIPQKAIDKKVKEANKKPQYCPKQKTSPKKIRREENRKARENRLEVDLVSDVGGSIGDKYLTADAGFQFRPFRDKEIALGVLANFGWTPDKTINSYSDSLPFGITVSGSEEYTNHLLIGASGELQLGPLIFGAGGGLARYIDNTKATIQSPIIDPATGEPYKKTSKDSEIISRGYWKAYAGLGIPVSKDVSLREIMGIQGSAGKIMPYDTLGFNVKLGPNARSDAGKRGK